ncbi:hypothetical protein [Roseofilum casamattae]|uniref:Uncharacterized protein n=1 Tax=Roseofilum casamattae BLCC-M143 TaxID=3022442 RepID=A0ABT7BUE8_9CYAN|nr:hypothetical protein [Roseofilum casamattae]MDJ1182818.1 hypothetical protein [Roseofilum casamattae BLCC-M143]
MARWQTRIKKPQRILQQKKANPQLARAIQAKLNVAQLDTEENARVPGERSPLEKSGSLLDRETLNQPDTASNRPASLSQSPIQRWSLQRDRSATQLDETAVPLNNSAVQRDETQLIPSSPGKKIAPQVDKAFQDIGHDEVGEKSVVHSGPEADSMAKSMNSHAYSITDNNTDKTHIVMQSRLANDIPTQTHEGTHTAHQHSSKSIKPNIDGTPINDDAVMEGNARANEKRIMSGQALEVEF